MLFPSATFIWLFLPAVLLLHTPLLRVSLTAANSFLVVASLIFYWWGSEELVLLLAISVIIDYLAADLASIARQRGRMRIVRGCVATSVIANVGLLGWFKYAGFLAESINDVSSRLGGGSVAVPSVILPIGISFFTFQSMSYTFDVAAGRIEPIGDPLRLLLYVSLFPQLIAGPIVRARDIRAELAHRTVRVEQLTEGFSRFVWGLAKKMLIADSVAPLVEAAYEAEPTMASAWIAAVGFAVQIYFDFSGYSDMAIGLGKMLGFTFPENFDRPYAAATITDFWRRWHITLSTWFRDYLYIPLGGNRGSKLVTYRNLIIVFLVTGVWHGAAWTFVVWGMWHGAALLIERRAGIQAHHTHPLLRVWTGFVVLGGWVLFNATDLTTASSIFAAALTPSLEVPSTVADAFTPLAAIALVGGAVISVLPGRFRPVNLLPVRSAQGEAIRLALYCGALPLVTVRVLSDAYTPFLYFQF